jgi:hypothetical protein
MISGCDRLGFCCVKPARGDDPVDRAHDDLGAITPQMNWTLPTGSHAAAFDPVVPGNDHQQTDNVGSPICMSFAAIIAASRIGQQVATLKGPPHIGRALRLASGVTTPMHAMG